MCWNHKWYCNPLRGNCTLVHLQWCCDYVLVQVWVSASIKISWLAFQNNIKDEGRKTDLTKPGHFSSKSGVGWAALPPKPKLYFRSVAALPLVCHWCRSQQWGTKKHHSSRQRAAGLCQSLVSQSAALLRWRIWRCTRHPFPGDLLGFN